MGKQLLSTSIQAPAFFGLNTQESGVTLEEGFAVEASNCVIDESGRLGARKGYTYVTSGSAGVGLRGVHNYVGNAGHVDYISWGNGKIYSGDLTLSILASGFSDNDWKATNYMGNVYLAQDNEDIRKIDSTLTISTLASTGIQKWGTVNAAYGRLWAARTYDTLGVLTDAHTVHFTAIGSEDFTGIAGAGTLDLRKIWTSGGDEVIHVAGFNGYIVIFCKNSVVIFGDENNGDPTIETASLNLVEVIENVGCIASGTIQDIGTDILFLTTSGLRSLNRVIQEKSNPISDLSSNVRDDMMKQVSFEDLNHVTGVYSPINSFYLLILPYNDTVYCFDTRGRLEDGAFRATIWNGMGVMSGCINKDGDLYFGMTNGISEYRSYLDGTSSYYMSYFTNYFDFGQPTINKILKYVGITLIGGSGQEFKLKTAVDYTDSHRTYIGNVKQSTVTEYDLESTKEYSDSDTYPVGHAANPDTITTDVYEAAEYGGGDLTDKIKLAIGGQGTVVQLGFEAEIQGDPLSIQKLDIYVKQGRSY